MFFILVIFIEIFSKKDCDKITINIKMEAEKYENNRKSLESDSAIISSGEDDDDPLFVTCIEEKEDNEGMMM